MRNLLGLRNEFKAESGKVYGVDSNHMSGKGKVMGDSVKLMTIENVLNVDKGDSYINLENVNNVFYFVSSKISSTKKKKPVLKTATTTNMTRITSSGIQSNLKQSLSVRTKDQPAKKPSDNFSKSKTLLTSVGPLHNQNTSFTTTGKRTNSISRRYSDKKSKITQLSKFNEHKSENLNLYSNPLSSDLTRLHQQKP